MWLEDSTSSIARVLVSFGLSIIESLQENLLSPAESLFNVEFFDEMDDVGKFLKFRIS